MPSSGVDEPTVLVVRACNLAAFFHQEGIARPGARQFAVDDLLGTLVLPG